MSKMLNRNRTKVCSYGCCRYYQQNNSQYRMAEKTAAEREIKEDTMSTGYGTLNNQVPAEQVVGKYTHEQLLTLADLAHIAAERHLVTRITTVPFAFSNGGLAQVEFANPDSYHRGAYYWESNAAIDQDGGFTIEGADEFMLERLEEAFTLVDDEDHFVKVFER